MSGRRALLGACTIALVLFSTRLPAPQVPDLRVAQAPHAAGCPPEPPPGGILDADPCVPYWALRAGSARNTVALRELRHRIDTLEQRLARLESPSQGDE